MSAGIGVRQPQIGDHGDLVFDRFEGREDGLWGVYRFKRGFGGQIRRTVGPVDRVYNRLVYRLYQRRRGQG